MALATTGPLLQRWYASLGPHTASTVYPLFAASNAGSFLALLGYPFLVEPMLRVRTQSIGWAVGYAVYALFMAACGIVVWRQASTPNSSVAATPPRSPAPRSRARCAVTVEEDDIWAARLRWLGLAAVPSTLMMSVTTFISTDVASMPLLWVVPLALYLLTFVIAFAERQVVNARLLQWLFAIALVAVIALVMAPPVYPLTLIVMHLTCFFIITLACHTALAASRPPPSRLPSSTSGSRQEAPSAGCSTR